MHDRDPEPLNALVQAQLPASARDRLHAAAQRRHLKLGVLLRVIALDWLDANEPARKP